MSSRRLFLDEGPGEARGVVLLDGLPERLLLTRHSDPPALALGARSVARVRKVERSFSSAFLSLPGGGEALLGLRDDQAPLTEGAAIEIEIRAEARPGKLPLARLLGTAEGDPRLLRPAPPLRDQLAAYAPDQTIVGAGKARDVADLAAEAAQRAEHALPSGGSIAIEPTRALTAVDVDLGGASGDGKKAARRANLEAIAHGARLLRLKSLGGLVVFDLVGKGHDANILVDAARGAFAADNPGVVIGSVSRFGTLELALPHRRTPLDPDHPAAQAAELARRLERAALADPGGRFRGLCSPAILEAGRPMLAELNARYGGRLSIQGEAGRQGLEVVPL